MIAIAKERYIRHAANGGAPLNLSQHCGLNFVRRLHKRNAVNDNLRGGLADWSGERSMFKKHQRDRYLWLPLSVLAAIGGAVAFLSLIV
jgi:hypothetical protein